MKRQYRIIRSVADTKDFYITEYSYKGLPFWFHHATYASLDKARQWIVEDKARKPYPPDRIVYRE